MHYSFLKEFKAYLLHHSNFRDIPNTANSNTFNSSVHHYHNYHSYSPSYWAPSYWGLGYPSQTIINHNHYNSSQIRDENDEKKNRQAVTGGRIMTGVLVGSTLIGSFYYLSSRWFDYHKEKKLLEYLKENSADYPILYPTAFRYLHNNVNYSRSILKGQSLMAFSGLSLLINWAYIDNLGMMYASLFVGLCGGLGIIYAYNLYRAINNERRIPILLEQLEAIEID